MINMQGEITKVLSNLYCVKANDKEYMCTVRGIFRNNDSNILVGDNVMFNPEKLLIEKILPRKNELYRPKVSNIDQAFVVTSLKNPDFSTNLLDKFLIILEHNKIEPIICLTKRDLLKEKEYEKLLPILNYYQNLGYKVIENTSITEIKKMFKDKTTVFTGQTGSGKSTLLNRLDSRLNLKVGEVSIALGRGRHTTRSVTLLSIFDGKVLDTPGFSKLDFIGMTNDDIKNGFKEFKKYPCPFNDCAHTNEKECAVKKSVLNKEILEERYNNYLSFIGGNK